MANQWFKFYGGEYLSDPKIERLSPAERSCWITLLAMASMTDDGVIEFLTVESLLTKSGIRMNPYNEGDWEKCQSIFVMFARMNMIIADEEVGTIIIKNWDKRQERTAQTPYERVKKHRKSKAKKENDNEMITHDNENDNVRREEKRREENILNNKVNKKSIILPDWLDVKLWTEWVEFRQAKKKPLSAISIKKYIEFLSGFKDQQAEIINNSIMNGYQGLFPPKTNYKKIVNNALVTKDRQDIIDAFNN